MEKSAVISELETIFRDYFDDPDLELTPETSQETIEDWDSLAQISLLVAIEKHFQVRFSMNQAAELKTFGKITDAILNMAG